MVDNNTGLDLFVPNGSLYRNDETTGNWLKIALTDVDSNQSRLNARVEFVVGKLRMIRKVTRKLGHELRNSSVVYGGLGTANRDRLGCCGVSGRQNAGAGQRVNYI